MKSCTAVIAFIALTTLLACHSKEPENVSGGGCSFREAARSPIRVYEIRPNGNDSTFDLLFHGVNKDGTEDTGFFVDYAYQMNRHVGPAEMKQYDIRVGSVCTYIYKQVVSGSCGEQKEISLEPYRE